jgi:hypothetical protein
VILRCAEYEPFHPEGVKKTRRPSWRRKPHPDYTVVLPLDPAKLVKGVGIPELRAMLSAIEEGKRSSCEIFRAVCRELSRQRDTLLESFVSDTFECDQLSEAYRLVSGKLGEAEAERFKACLLKLAQQVARSSGGWLASWGWLRGVERRALTELSRAFSASL